VSRARAGGGVEDLVATLGVGVDGHVGLGAEGTGAAADGLGSPGGAVERRLEAGDGEGARRLIDGALVGSRDVPRRPFGPDHDRAPTVGHSLTRLIPASSCGSQRAGAPDGAITAGLLLVAVAGQELIDVSGGPHPSLLLGRGPPRRKVQAGPVERAQRSIRLGYVGVRGGGVVVGEGAQHPGGARVAVEGGGEELANWAAGPAG
jgi:hypothetical protein